MNLFEGFCKRKEKENRKPLSSAQPAAQPVIFFLSATQETSTRRPTSFPRPNPASHPFLSSLPPTGGTHLLGSSPPPCAARTLVDSQPDPTAPPPRRSPPVYKQHRPSPLEPRTRSAAFAHAQNPSSAPSIAAAVRSLLHRRSAAPRRVPAASELRVEVSSIAEPFFSLYCTLSVPRAIAHRSKTTPPSHPSPLPDRVWPPPHLADPAIEFPV